MTLKTLTVKALIFLAVFPVTPTIAVLTSLYGSLAYARNDYLQGYFQQCQTGDVSIYSDYRLDESDNMSRYNDNGGSTNNRIEGRDGNSKSIGVRWTWYLGSNCTDTTKALILENMELAQQLELLKMCKRYNNKKLPPQFATLAKKCEGVVDGVEIDDRPPEGTSYYDEIMKDIKNNPDKHKNTNTYYSEELKDILPEEELRNTKQSKPLVVPEFD